ADSCSVPSLYSATITELTAGLDRGCFTSVDLVTAYLARIDDVNSELHAVLEVNPDALAIAAALDAERQAGTTRGPLHGVPILVKDNIATFDQMNTTAGSYGLLGAKVAEDSTVVAKLRNAGAVILGKANMSQWAMYRSSNSTSGWTSRGGQTYGPFYTHMDPYGSSSGSGVAAAIGLSFAALGTETRGSILVPASKNNVVGIKPTVGLTSRHLVIPITERQDTVGPLARTVLDAATVLAAIAGVDASDNYTSAIPDGGVLPDYVAAASNPLNLTGVRIGVPRNAIESDLLYGNVNATVILAAFEAALDVLRGLGADIVDPANFSDATHTALDNSLGSSALNSDAVNCASGFISGLPAYMAQLTENPHGIASVADLRAFTIADAREDYPDRDVLSWDVALALGYNLSSPESAAWWQAGIDADAAGGVTGVCNQLGLAAVVIPTEYAPTWASSPGLPAVSVPLGAYPDDVPLQAGLRELVAVAPGIPFGISFVGKHWSEATLIGIAAAFEAATKFRDGYVLGPNSTVPTTDLADVIAAGNGSASATSTVLYSQGESLKSSLLFSIASLFSLGFLLSL
ncbi:hypothetical protein HK405_011831, partial [Cladochytrium tenue]